MSVKSTIKPRVGGVPAATSSGDGFQKLHDDFITYLYVDHGAAYNENVKKLEEASGQKREIFAYGFIALNCVYMIIES